MRTTSFTLKPDLYLTVVSSIKKAGKLPKGILSPQQLTWYTKRLRVEGVIRKAGYGTWELDEAAWQRFQQVQVSPQHGHPRLARTFTSSRIRGHGFMLRVRLPRFHNWAAKRKELLSAAGLSFQPARAGYEKFSFKDHKMWLGTQSLVIYSPEGMSYFASSAEESKKYALYDLLELVSSLESRLGVSFKRGSHYHWQFSKQHYADVKNALARQYGRDGKVLRVADFRGEWLLIDYSLGKDKPELETVHSESAVEDMDEVVEPFFNQLKETRLLPKDILTLFKHSAKVQAEVSANQELYARNIASHIDAIQKLGAGVEELQRVVANLGQAQGSPRSNSSPGSYIQRKLKLKARALELRGEGQW